MVHVSSVQLSINKIENTCRSFKLLLYQFLRITTKNGFMTSLNICDHFFYFLFSNGVAFTLMTSPEKGTGIAEQILVTICVEAPNEGQSLHLTETTIVGGAKQPWSNWDSNLDSTMKSGFEHWSPHQVGGNLSDMIA